MKENVYASLIKKRTISRGETNRRTISGGETNTPRRNSFELARSINKQRLKITSTQYRLLL